MVFFLLNLFEESFTDDNLDFLVLLSIIHKHSNTSLFRISGEKSFFYNVTAFVNRPFKYVAIEMTTFRIFTHCLHNLFNNFRDWISRRKNDQRNLRNEKIFLTLNDPFFYDIFYRIHLQKSERGENIEEIVKKLN